MPAPPRAFDFAGDVAIVTGAGSRMDGKVSSGFPHCAPTAADSLTRPTPAGEIGNGRAAAVLLARHGAKVALVDSNYDWAKETKRMIDEEGGISEIIEADITDEEACKNVVAKTVALWGAVHILVNIG